MNRAARLLGAVSCVAVATCAAVAQPATQPSTQPPNKQAPRETFWSFPADCVAYAAVDGSGFGKDDARTRAVVAASLRGLLGTLVPIEDGSSVAAHILRGEVLGEARYRLCLLELAGESVEPKNRRAVRAVRPTKFAAVIEVHAPGADGGHQRLEAAIEGGLAADHDGGPRDRKTLALGGGLKGYVSTSGAEWRDVAWVSGPQSFVVGFGRGTLEKWMKGAGRAERAAWWEQRGSVQKKRGRSELAIEVFADLNALRTGIPDEMGAGALNRFVHAWRIANARTFMLHASWVGGGAAKAEGEEAAGKLLAVDVSWTSRAEEPGAIKTISVSEGKWPAELTGVAPPAANEWAMVVRAGVPTCVDMGLDTYEALGDPGFGAVRSRWERRAKPILERVVPRIGEWVVVRPGAEVSLTLRPAKAQDRLAADLRAFFVTMAPVVVTEGKGWRLEGEGAEEILRGLQWRVEGNAVVSGWGANNKR